MPWAVAGAGITAGAGLIGGAMQSGAAKDAQKQASWARQLGIQQEQVNYNQAQTNLAPFYSGGTAATGAEADLLGLNGPDAAKTAMDRFQTSPGYQFQMEQGLRGVDAGAAAKGMLRSGATLKAEDTFAQGLANSDFGQDHARLNALSGQGFQAATGMNAAGGNLTGAILGQAGAAGNQAIAGANAQNSITGNEASSIGTAFGGALQNKGVQSLLTSGWNSLFSPAAAPNYMAGTTNAFGTSPGYGTQTFNPGGVF